MGCSSSLTLPAFPIRMHLLVNLEMSRMQSTKVNLISFYFIFNFWVMWSVPFLFPLLRGKMGDMVFYLRYGVKWSL